MGNYKGFGDSKIVPNLPAEKLEAFFMNTVVFQKNPNLASLWTQIKGLVYDLSHKKCHLGLGEKGNTTYFSSNCTSDDAELVSRYFKSIQMEAYNNRVIKTVVNGVNHYEVKTLFKNSFNYCMLNVFVMNLKDPPCFSRK